MNGRALSFQCTLSAPSPSVVTSMSAISRASSTASALSRSIKSMGLYAALPPACSNGSRTCTSFPSSRRRRAVTAAFSGFTSTTKAEPRYSSRFGITADTPLPDRVGASVIKWPSPSQRRSRPSRNLRPSRSPSSRSSSPPVPHRAVPWEPDALRRRAIELLAVTPPIAVPSHATAATRAPSEMTPATSGKSLYATLQRTNWKGP
jgi:hypothetical protein